MVGVGEEEIHFPAMKLVEVDLAVSQGKRPDQGLRVKGVSDLCAYGVVGADGFVLSVPETEGGFRDPDAEAALEMLQGLGCGVAEVVVGDRLHDELHRIAGVFGDLVDEGVSAYPAAIALALVVQGLAHAFFDDASGAAGRT